MLSTWDRSYKLASFKSQGFLGDSTKILTKGLGSQALCTKLSIPLRGLEVKLWEWSLRWSGDPQEVQLPTIQSNCLRKPKAPSRASPGERPRVPSGDVTGTGMPRVSETHFLPALPGTEWRIFALLGLVLCCGPDAAPGDGNVCPAPLFYAGTM